MITIIMIMKITIMKNNNDNECIHNRGRVQKARKTENGILQKILNTIANTF